MPRPRRSLASLSFAAPADGRFIADNIDHVSVGDLRGGSCSSGSLADLRGKSVLLATQRQLPTVLAAIELDGLARRMLLCPPDLAPHLPNIVAEADVDAVLYDNFDSGPALPGVARIRVGGNIVSAAHTGGASDIETEWILFTSGTTGRPKLVAHTLASLSGPLNDGVTVASGAVWSTFYDVRRYGGLQILLRAMIGGGSLVLSSATEPVDAFLARLGDAAVTHISGTPSHWRRALMSRSATLMSPAYVRLSGEVADQAILDRLRDCFPAANIAHAYASTEAGVAFDVRDGLAGFPVAFLADDDRGGVQMRVEAGTLRILSSRNASGYVGGQLATSDGFIDTGDIVERRGDRFYFVGRKEGVINVGGMKVYPEEVEDVINQHPAVEIARVWPRKSPVTGAVVAADVMLKAGAAGEFAHLRASLAKTCRDSLAAYKVPVSWRRVDSIELSASGKIRRA